MPWLGAPAHARWLEAEGDRLLAFGKEARRPQGGFDWLDDRGRPDTSRPLELLVSCRMTHVFSLGHLMGRPGCGLLADHGMAGLRDLFHDNDHGGWFARVGGGGPPSTDKTAYEHAFVVLAAASATAARRPGAVELLEEALGVLLHHFWDESPGMVVERWDRTWSSLDGYRGVNANMHTVEALLAAADVVADASLREKALRILTRVVHLHAAGNDWRIPEHFDASWSPLPDYNADEPAHPFRPYGATVGHSFEWARLAVHLSAALGEEAPPWLLDDACSLFAAAADEGWSVDGAPGFVYTVGWTGQPVVRQRMHWVAAEAVAAAAALHAATGDASYDALYTQWWDYVEAFLIDREHGSWHHELSPGNEPSDLTWQGKPDIYHAFQATLLPRLPLAPTAAVALAGGLLA